MAFCYIGVQHNNFFLHHQTLLHILQDTYICEMKSLHSKSRLHKDLFQSKDHQLLTYDEIKYSKKLKVKQTGFF